MDRRDDAAKHSAMDIDKDGKIIKAEADIYEFGEFDAPISGIGSTDHLDGSAGIDYLVTGSIAQQKQLVRDLNKAQGIGCPIKYKRVELPDSDQVAAVPVPKNPIERAIGAVGEAIETVLGGVAKAVGAVIGGIVNAIKNIVTANNKDEGQDNAKPIIIDPEARATSLSTLRLVLIFKPRIVC